jgi:hypothetical protein
MTRTSDAVDRHLPVQGLWVGDRLPVMQQISIASFLASGHDFHLYTYSKLKNVPNGAVVRDAAEIIPLNEVFENAGKRTFAAFSDFFRYKLILDRGGWWADVDMVCIRPFDLTRPYVFSSEHELARERTNSGVIKAPAGAAILQEAWKTCKSKDRSNLAWGEVGPELLSKAVTEFGLDDNVEPAITFCPLPAHLWKSMLHPQERFIFGRRTLSVHLWHELWRKDGWDVDADYAPGCLYEQFKTVFLNQRNINPRYTSFEVLS